MVYAWKNRQPVNPWKIFTTTDEAAWFYGPQGRPWNGELGESRDLTEPELTLVISLVFQLEDPGRRVTPAGVADYFQGTRRLP